MSYSRWIFSDMYTYRIAQSDLTSHIEESFCCHWDIEHSTTFTYNEVLDYVIDPNSLWEFDQIKSLDQLHELIKYFREFLRDVKKEWNL
tara:strand:- start:20652 stop:20918 length:267 start_codon:yes stop_codon:yes gene_type:complete